MIGATLAALRLRTEQHGYPGGRRTLVIHSGGDSKRLPHCSAQGKLFARVPRTLPDGRASTIFDEFLISLSGLAPVLPPGALIASGDVLLVFDHLQLSFRRQGATGVAAAAPAEMGQRHGVFVSDGDSARVAAYLHKPDAAELARWAAVREGQVQIDTGLVWLDADMIRRLGAIGTDPTVSAAPLNLYGDLLRPLAGSTEYGAYLQDESDGPATPAVRAAREIVWRLLRGTAFAVEQVQPAVFVHFGSSREYWQMAADDPELAAFCGWEAQAASWLGQRVQAAAVPLVTINAVVEGPLSPGSGVLLVSDCCLEGQLAWQGPALLSGVRSAAPLVLRSGIGLDQLSIRGDATVTRCFGLYDDPKRRVSELGATFCNTAWGEWLAAADVTPVEVWGNLPEREWTLWNARLFPALGSREESLALALPLQHPASAPDGWQAKWLAARRLSLGESVALADGERIVAGLIAIEDRVASQRFLAGVTAEAPAATVSSLLGSLPATCIRRATLVDESLKSADATLQLRGYRALSEATGDLAWEDAAFAILARTIKTVTLRSAPAQCKAADVRWVACPPCRVSAAARIDFGGGWTDTAPHSIERGGSVLNAAITLNGEYPITAEARFLDEPRLVLESRDLDMAIEPQCAGEVQAYGDPSDPFALHKAALVLRGVIPADAPAEIPLVDLLREVGGIHLTTATRIPFGSGLGTSSILAGAVLVALGEVIGTDRPDDAQLFDEVLCLEQMLTTGGGWQDQVGGLTGGIKLVTSQPGLPQRITVKPLDLNPATERELATRLCLVYTGQQRLAKNLLRNVMSRWMAREPEMVWIQGEIARLSLAMRDALQSGDVDGFGALLGEHWLLNKRMDPGCANPFIDGLFDAMGPYINGGKLAGAGGGGFASVIARSAEHAAELSDAIAERYPGTRVAIWSCAIPSVGFCVELGEGT
jgi:fucokinase